MQYISNNELFAKSGKAAPYWQLAHVSLTNERKTLIYLIGCPKLMLAVLLYNTMKP